MTNVKIEIDHRRWSKRCPPDEDQHKKQKKQFLSRIGNLAFADSP